MSYEWLEFLPPRAYDFVDWMLEDESIEGSGVPFRYDQSVQLHRFGLTPDMINSLLQQPWVFVIGDKMHARSEEAFWAWCILVGYLTKEQIELLKARLLMLLMGPP